MLRSMEGELQRRLGESLRAHREGLGLSQEAFAHEIGVHRTYLGGVERGERNLTLRSVERIADLVGIDALVLLGAAPARVSPAATATEVATRR